MQANQSPWDSLYVTPLEVQDTSNEANDGVCKYKIKIINIISTAKIYFGQLAAGKVAHIEIQDGADIWYQSRGHSRRVKRVIQGREAQKQRDKGS